MEFVAAFLGPIRQGSSGEGHLSLLVGCRELLRFEANGDIYVRGEKVDSNRKVYEEFREWLSMGLAAQRKA